MAGTRAELASRFDLAAFADVAAQPWQILVVDMADAVDAELADFAARRIATAATAAGSAASTRATPAGVTLGPGALSTGAETATGSPEPVAGSRSVGRLIVSRRGSALLIVTHGRVSPVR